jgi:hypothetical protein
MKSGLLFISIFISLTGFAQSIVKPYSRVIENKWIQNSSYEMTWFAKKDTQMLEMGTVKTEILIKQEQLYIISRVKLKNVNAEWNDTTIADVNSFAPIYHSSYNMQRDMVLRFGNIVKGYYYDKRLSSYSEITDTTVSDYFDSNIYPYLVRLLPLQDGYSTTLPIYDYNPGGKRGVLNAFVKKVESGTLIIDNKTKNVWVVTVTDELSADNKTLSTYFIGKEDRKLLKHEIISSGREMVMILK